MLSNYNEYLIYELPNNWIAEENIETLVLYNPNGNGAITISFFSVFDVSKSLDEQICILAKKFIDQNNITSHSPLIFLEKKGKSLLSGSGITSDGWFVKIWIVAKSHKIVFATYQSEQKNPELKICDSIIDSIEFTF